MTERKASWWHRLMHWLDFVDEFNDVYSKDDGMVYMCQRCSHCGNARQEIKLGKISSIYLHTVAQIGKDT